jgi:hypothetical protein
MTDSIDRYYREKQFLVAFFSSSKKFAEFLLFFRHGHEKRPTFTSFMCRDTDANRWPIFVPILQVEV